MIDKQPHPVTDPWHAHSVRVRRVIAETPGIATYELAMSDPNTANSYQFLPGQFNMLYVPGIGESAISISSDPETPQILRHTIRIVGGVTAAIAEGGVGMSLGLRGPFGSSWPIDQCSPTEKGKRDIMIVAGGIGLAPLRSLIYALRRHRDRFGKIVVMIGAKWPKSLLYGNEYANWRKDRIEVQTTVDRVADGWQGNVGVVTALMNRCQLDRPEQSIVMSCGPEVMMRYVVQTALARGIPASNIWLSLERNMNCAVGLCGHCQLGPEFLCKDGPVLPYSRVADWLKVQAF